MSLRILHVALSFTAGGRREAIRSLALGLRSHAVSSHICALHTLDLDDERDPDWFDGSLQLDRNSLLDRHALLTLRRYCREHAIDIVHSHDGASQFSSVLALPWRGPEVLMTFHRSLGFESATWRDRLRNRIAGWRSGAIVTASRERREHYLEENHIAAGKVLCIPLGIDTTRFQPESEQRVLIRNRLGIGDDATLVGAAGHFGHIKGIDLAIRAFQECRYVAANRNCHLVVLGRGDTAVERAMQSLVREDMRERVHLVGFQEHPEHWFNALDVFLHGARQEAFGLVLAEAMACGVPIVAARVGGIPEVVRDGVGGVLVDSPNADLLATALDDLLQDDERRKALGSSAAAHARQALSRDRYVNDYLALYQQLDQRH